MEELKDLDKVAIGMFQELKDNWNKKYDNKTPKWIGVQMILLPVEDTDLSSDKLNYVRDNSFEKNLASFQFVNGDLFKEK